MRSTGQQEIGKTMLWKVTRTKIKKKNEISQTYKRKEIFYLCGYCANIWYVYKQIVLLQHYHRHLIKSRQLVTFPNHIAIFCHLFFGDFKKSLLPWKKVCCAGGSGSFELCSAPYRT